MLMEERFRIYSDNEWPHGDMGLADGLEGGTSFDPAPGILSLARYDFNLTARSLCVDDVDILVTQADGSLCKGPHPVKRISEKVTKTDGSIRRLPKTPSLSNASTWREVAYAIGNSKRVEDSTTELEIRARGRTKEVSLELTQPLTISKDSQVAISMRHELQLTGEGQELFSGGAVQPSDYKASRKHLKVSWARKLITIRLFSKQQHFKVWFFDASKQCAFPVALSPKRETHQWSWEHQLIVEMPPWDRAQYFSVFAQPTSAG